MRDLDVFEFCPKCGGKCTKFLERGYLKCRECEYIFYVTPNPSVGGLILNEEDKILLIKRKNNPHKGALDIPAGFTERSETLEQALKREMLEEVGLSNFNFEYFNSTAGDYEYLGVVKQFICANFVIRINSTEHSLNAGDDAESFKFYGFDEIDYNEIKFTTSKNAIIDLMKYLKIKK